MWIRCQDSYTLIKCERLSIRQSITRRHCVIGNECVVLGEYSTEEKALRVLNGIQDAIEDTDYYRIDNIGHGTYALGKGVQVYQMPQDEDVEI